MLMRPTPGVRGELEREAGLASLLQLFFQVLVLGEKYPYDRELSPEAAPALKGL